MYKAVNHKDYDGAFGQRHYSHHLQFLLSGTVKKQGAESLEPGGKQDQDTGNLFFNSTSLTRYPIQVLLLQSWASPHYRHLQ